MKAHNPTSNLIFIVGGSRSGKSRFSVELAKKAGKKTLFIATCIAQDEEMKERISKHKRSRPRHWKVIEEDRDIKRCLVRLKDRFDTVIIDCLGLYISNLLSKNLSFELIRRDIESIAKTLKGSGLTSLVISNEVGGGIVPQNRLARQFRDIMGLANQIMSRYADTVYIMQAGIPVKIK